MDKIKLWKEVRNWALTLLAAFFIAILFNSKVCASVTIDQSSMEYTLYPEQRLIIDKFSYNFSNPKRGDIITFFENETKGNIIHELNRSFNNFISIFNKSSAESNRLIKRVIAIEGDVVDIKDGSVYVNGEKLDEPYIHDKTDPGEMEFPITIGKNQLFVLGDNREVSIDSRIFGTINCNQVEGKAFLRIYPFKKMGKIK